MTTRIAVLFGLYRSGSSAAAGVLHHLGVEMGAPYWMDNYESARLARRLRRWWHEPDSARARPPRPSACASSAIDLVPSKRAARPTSAPSTRRFHFAATTWPQPGVPRSALSGPGGPLDESIASIQRTGWFKPHGERSCSVVPWDDVNRFFTPAASICVSISPDMLADPAREIRRIAGLCRSRAGRRSLLPPRFSLLIRPESGRATDAPRTAASALIAARARCVGPSARPIRIWPAGDPPAFGGENVAGSGRLPAYPSLRDRCAPRSMRASGADAESAHQRAAAKQRDFGLECRERGEVRIRTAHRTRPAPSRRSIAQGLPADFRGSRFPADADIKPPP